MKLTGSVALIALFAAGCSDPCSSGPPIGCDYWVEFAFEPPLSPGSYEISLLVGDASEITCRLEVTDLGSSDQCRPEEEFRVQAAAQRVLLTEKEHGYLDSGAPLPVRLSIQSLGEDVETAAFLVPTTPHSCFSLCPHLTYSVPTASTAGEGGAPE